MAQKGYRGTRDIVRDSASNAFSPTAAAEVFA